MNIYTVHIYTVKYIYFNTHTISYRYINTHTLTYIYTYIHTYILYHIDSISNLLYLHLNLHSLSFDAVIETWNHREMLAILTNTRAEKTKLWGKGELNSSGSGYVCMCLCDSSRILNSEKQNAFRCYPLHKAARPFLRIYECIYV